MQIYIRDMDVAETNIKVEEIICYNDLKQIEEYEYSFALKALTWIISKLFCTV